MPSALRDTAVLRRIKVELPELNPAMARIARAILADPPQAASATITALAQRAQTSPTAVTRFAVQLGFEGFPTLRSAIAVDTGRSVQSGWERDIGAAITPSDTPAEVLDILAGTEARALRDAVSMIDVPAVERAAWAVAHSGRVHLHADWADGIPARELYLRLLRIGVPIWFHNSDHETVEAVTPLLGSADVVMVLNRSGLSTTLLDVVSRARAQGTHTVAIHGDPDSRLARAVQTSLFTGIHNGSVWTQYYAGRASDTLLASMLWVLVAQMRTGFDDAHPLPLQGVHEA